jgi:NAD(P)H dehydrogenase (quinone)
MILVTGASGKLGGLVVAELLTQVPAAQVAAGVRTPAKAAGLAAKGVQVRELDYDRPATVAAALAGVDKVLLVSASEPGKRLPQHLAVIEAAKKAGVKLLAYTSIPAGAHARMELAKEHVATEAAIRASGVPFAFLRNGWYIENYSDNAGPALAHGALLGAAGSGKLSPASRADFARAAAKVLATPGHEGKAYELGGDEAVGLAEIASFIGKAAGKEVVYKDLPAGEFEKLLVSFGLPAGFARVLADADVGISKGELLVMSGDLRRLIGRPTEKPAEVITRALRK